MTRKAGLPSNFAPKISAAQFADVPADLGAYLDDDPLDVPPPTSKRKKKKTVKSNTQAAAHSKIAGRIQPKEEGRGQEQLLFAPQPPRPRKQLNMTTDTIQKVDDLVLQLRSDGPQPDASYSELHAAMVEALWLAREQLDFSAVPLRGHWGNPSAKVFVESLTSAIARAIVKHQTASSHHQKSDAAMSIPVPPGRLLPKH